MLGIGFLALVHTSIAVHTFWYMVHSGCAEGKTCTEQCVAWGTMYVVKYVIIVSKYVVIVSKSLSVETYEHNKRWSST